MLQIFYQQTIKNIIECFKRGLNNTFKIEKNLSIHISRKWFTGKIFCKDWNSEERTVNRGDFDWFEIFSQNKEYK